MGLVKISVALMKRGVERKFGGISVNTEDVNESIVSDTKKLRIGSSTIDSHWRHVDPSARSSGETPREVEPSTNSHLPYINALLRELHFYRQARRTSGHIATESGNTSESINNPSRGSSCDHMDDG